VVSLRHVYHRVTPWLAAGALVVSAGCKSEAPPGSIEVSDFRLVGVHAFKPDQILNVLATRRSSRMAWLPSATRHYFNRADFEADLRRIEAFYADHGYPNVHVTKTDVALNNTKTAVALTVTVDEGAPIIVDDVRYEGFDTLSVNAQDSLSSAPLKAGSVRDHDTVKTTRDQAAGLFRNAGYPEVYVDAGERPSATANHVIITFRADPGPKMTFGEVTVDGLEHVDQSVVTREMAFKTGATFRSSQVQRSQHRLQRLAVFSVVSVTPRPEEATGDSVPIHVTVAEAKPRQLKLGLGYGSEEHARATLNWQHANFMGGARLFDVDSKWSSIDRGVKFNFVEPYVGRFGLELALTGTLWDVRQLTYDSQTYGGRATMTYRHETRLGVGRPPVRYGFHVTYIHEYLRYGVQPDALADQSNRAQLIAMGLNPITGRGSGTLAGLDFDFDRDVVDNQVDPHRGLGFTAHYEHAAPWLFGSYRFNEVGGDVHGYVPVGDWVLAMRGHVSSIGAASPDLMPFSKLYFLGGALSERGWGRFEISPLDANGNPIGGRTLGEGTVELRIPLTPKVGVVGFVDAGDVTNNSWDFRGLRPKWDVGAGVRYLTPIGLVRADFGHQINHIPGLLVNGSPETRYWRFHFAIGQAF
jgi:outer membrane protein assembly complex protein YaeT